ncbi:hypothetical protein D3C77_593500 [compost metagenome]
MGNRRAQVAFAVAQCCQCLFQLGGGGVLEQVAMGAAFQGLHDQFGIGMHRQDQDLAAAAAGAQLGQGVEAVGRTHGNVQQDNVRLQLQGQLRHLAAVIAFTHHRVPGDI